MKKALIISSLFAILALGLFSCKTTNDCPAYNKVEKVEKGLRA